MGKGFKIIHLIIKLYFTIPKFWTSAPYSGVPCAANVPYVSIPHFLLEVLPNH